MTTFAKLMGTTIGNLDFAGPASLQPCWRIPNFFQDSGALIGCHYLFARSHLLSRMCRLLARMCRMSDVQFIEVARQDCTFTVVYTYSPQTLTTDHYGRMVALSVRKLCHDDTCLDHPHWCSLAFVVPAQHSPFRTCPRKNTYGLFMDSLALQQMSQVPCMSQMSQMPKNLMPRTSQTFIVEGSVANLPVGTGCAKLCGRVAGALRPEFAVKNARSHVAHHHVRRGRVSDRGRREGAGRKTKGEQGIGTSLLLRESVAHHASMCGQSSETEIGAGRESLSLKSRANPRTDCFARGPKDVGQVLGREGLKSCSGVRRPQRGPRRLPEDHGYDLCTQGLVERSK